MKSAITLFLAVIAVLLSNAQVLQRRCGTYDLEKYQEQLHPGYMARVNACFNLAKQIAQANRQNRSANDTIYHVRLVFHIVSSAAIEDIPDSVVYSQVQVLNEDYRRLNADTIKTRDEFKPVAADAGIEFELATTDPDGNPTTGITHDQGSPGFLGFSPWADDVKESAQGGVDPWPTDKYVNIWVCNILNGLGVLGYSFPPDNAPNWPNGSATDSAHQGVVLYYAAVGRNFSAPIDPTVAKGRSCTHELGHFFGLRHIWGDGDCTMDDGLDDTPDAAAADQQTCDTTSNTCPDSPVDFPDMLENYMDYSDDRCLNMFTQEQVGVMRAMLQTSRAGVATIETVSSIHNPAEDNFESVNVYPNPTNDVLNINVYIRNNSSYSIALYNSLGEKINELVNLPAHTVYRSFNLANQPAGIYFAKISSGTQVLVKRFVLAN